MIDPNIQLAQLMASAPGWQMVTDENDTYAMHTDSRLRLRAWGAAGVGVSLHGRDNERIGACYSRREDGLPDAMAAMLDPIIAALTAARGQVAP